MSGYIKIYLNIPKKILPLEFENIPIDENIFKRIKFNLNLYKTKFFIKKI